MEHPQRSGDPLAITVRIRVARSELMPATPTFAKIAVSAANTAERIAQSCQELMVSGDIRSLIRHCERSEAIQNLTAEIVWIASSRSLSSVRPKRAGPVGSSQ